MRIVVSAGTVGGVITGAAVRASARRRRVAALRRRGRARRPASTSPSPTTHPLRRVRRPPTCAPPTSCAPRVDGIVAHLGAVDVLVTAAGVRGASAPPTRSTKRSGTASSASTSRARGSSRARCCRAWSRRGARQHREPREHRGRSKAVSRRRRTTRRRRGCRAARRAAWPSTTARHDVARQAACARAMIDDADDRRAVRDRGHRRRVVEEDATSASLGRTAPARGGRLDLAEPAATDAVARDRPRPRTARSRSSPAARRRCPATRAATDREPT